MPARATDNEAPRFEARRLPIRAIEPPGERELHLWYLQLDALGNPLDPDADTRGDIGPRSVGISRQRTLRRFYLRLLLGAYLGVPGKDVSILRDPRGKPFLDPACCSTPLSFSIARSDGRALIAVGRDAPVGVDLEPAGRAPGDALNLARRYFSAAEADALARLEGESLRRAFLHTWACKEAVVKASGRGIANQLCRFTVSIDPDAAPAVLDSQEGDADQWTLLMVFPEPDHLGAVAMHAPEVSVRAWRLLAPTTESAGAA